VPDSGIVMPGHLLASSFHGPAWLTGGTVGPEGSAFDFVVMAILFVVFDRVYQRQTVQITPGPGTSATAGREILAYLLLVLAVFGLRPSDIDNAAAHGDGAAVVGMLIVPALLAFAGSLLLLRKRAKAK